LSDNETEFKKLAIMAQSGDKNSYENLLNGISSFLKNYLHHRIFDKNEIDELKQEILIATHRSLHTYNSEKSFMGWFLAITEHKIIDYIRSLKKRENLVDIESIHNILTNTDSDLKLDIDKAINQLSIKEKKVIMLIKVRGHSLNEVAEQLNLTEANVKVIAHRAYINIKNYLGIQS